MSEEEAACAERTPKNRVGRCRTCDEIDRYLALDASHGTVLLGIPVRQQGFAGPSCRQCPFSINTTPACHVPPLPR